MDRMSACWEHLKSMREIDKKSMTEGDFICIHDGKLQSYWSSVIEWEECFYTEVEYQEEGSFEGLYCCYAWDDKLNNTDELEPMIEMFSSELDIAIRNERIDSVLS